MPGGPGGRPKKPRRDPVPPAAAILSRADAEKACTLTWSATVTPPEPRILTGRPSRTAPLATRSSTLTSPPAGYSEDRRSRLTTWYSVRNGFLNPRSFGRRMCMGICPPSNAADTW